MLGASKERGLPNLNTAPGWIMDGHTYGPGRSRSSGAHQTHVGLLPRSFSYRRHMLSARLVSAGVPRCRRSVHSVLHRVLTLGVTPTPSAIRACPSGWFPTAMATVRGLSIHCPGNPNNASAVSKVKRPSWLKRSATDEMFAKRGLFSRCYTGCNTALHLTDTG